MPADGRRVRVLAPALAVARRLLRELEVSDVPAAVRRVAASSAERLPPPLARSLIREIEGNAWLRAKVVESWKADPAPGSPDAVRASELFLERPDGWEEELEAIVTQRHEADLSSEVERLRRREQELREDLETARRRARDAERRAEHSERATARRPPSASSALAARDARIADLTRQLEQHRRALAALESLLSEERERLVRLRRRLLRARRSSTGETAAPPPSPWSIQDPMALVRHLDELVDALAAEPPAEVITAEPARLPWALPSGVRPDRREAIDWLLQVPTPFSLVVDGYNAAFQLDSERFHTPEARARLNRALADLRHRSAARARVIVVYDSDRGLPQRRAGSKRGVDVRYTSAGLQADEEILDLVGRIEGRVVVVSSDRLVREGAEDQGALGLWSEALSGWISRSVGGTTPSPPSA